MQFTPLVRSVNQWLRDKGGTPRELAQRLDVLDGRAKDTVAFWMGWAEHVVATHGLVRPSGPPSSLGDYFAPGDGVKQWMAQQVTFLDELHALSRVAPTNSAERFASQLLAESLFPHSEEDPYAPPGRRSAGLAALIGNIFVTIERERAGLLLPLADRARKDQAQARRKATLAASKKREKALRELRVFERIKAKHPSLSAAAVARLFLTRDTRTSRSWHAATADQQARRVAALQRRLSRARRVRRNHGH